MPLTGDELVCPKFQPNIFDSTRCHDCLRQKHLHNSSPEHDTTAAHSQGKDTSTKEDSDVLSVVSSYCDVSRGGCGFKDGSLCILSADCDLCVCDGDDDQSSDSQCDDSIYSSSVSVEEETNVLHYPSSHCRMTRLDQSSHRSSPRGWTEVARSRDAFGSLGFSHGSAKEKRDRESGYFSLGRAAGSRAICDKGSPPPYRHSERGHPLPSNKSPEPKATIPFRNPGLGVPSERRTGEIQNADLMNYPPQPLTPDPVDLSVEVEALAGPRSLSPTPFKQAESLITSKRRVERNLPSSSYPMLGSSQRSSSLSRSSSPGRSISPLRRGESTSSLNTLGFRSGSLVRGREKVSGTPARNGHAGGSQKNLRSLASTVGTVSSVSKSYMDLRGSSRNSEKNSSPVGSTLNRGGSTPSRRSNDGPRQTSVWKSETSPSFEYSHERQSSPHAGRQYDARSQSPKGRKEMDRSSNQIREGRRSASPVRKGYGTEKRSTSNGWCYNRESPPSSRKGYNTQIQASLKKAEVKRASRHSSPSRGHHQSPDQSSLYKTKTSQVNLARELKSRSSSPLRWGNDNPSQSLPRKTEIGRRSATLRHDPTGHAPLRNTASDRTDSASYVKDTNKSQCESNPPLGHWRGSTHSLLSQSVSRSSSPSRNSSSHRSAPVAWETSQSVSKRSSVKPEREIQSSTPNRRPSVSQKQSLSPSMQRHTSSQSSMDSESSHLSAGSSGLNREEYTMMADLPKVKTVMQREGPSHLDRLRSQQRRELSLYKPASHCQSKAPNSDWDEVEEERDAGRLSRAHSPSSLHTQTASSPSSEQIHKNPSRSSEHKQKAHRPSVYFSCSVEQTDEESVQQARANIFI
ncbi:serine/arginine repetitive matrix protein 2 [Triplophysa rosa]|uniref:serine/arginine repetitive matrix protein 2 n=1 Tax=Triplophysa rosa TaxID=992332 RepID=UPI002545F670|nr:serine/arginine repetitive matrix protein 2 [Triplophysa rosa]